MKILNQKNAKEFALEKFEQMSDLYKQWNILHSEGIIEILKILNSDKQFDSEKLFSLAWIHDVGKIRSEKNHAMISFEILSDYFYLDEEDEDCILNHGSSMNPKTKEGKIFRYSDGLSLFTEKIIEFRIFAERLENKSEKEIYEEIKKDYEKYKNKYSDSKEIISLLNELYKKITNKYSIH